jgi:uncharacterized membrane protein YcaP (DUF421 family)
MAAGWLGTDAQHILWWQMCIRAVLIFLFGIAVIRIFGRKAFGKQSSIDIVLAMVIGSTLSRTLTANAPFVPTLCATLVIILCYWMFAQIAARSRLFARLVKGEPIELVRGGHVDHQRLRWSGASEADIAEAARKSGLPSLSHVRKAVLERSGDISALSED